MNNVAIITFHWANNYGAVLQSYALQQTVISLGSKCEIIDYKPFPAKHKSGLKKLNRKISELFGGYKRQLEFEAFRRKYLSLTAEYSRDQLYSQPPQFDAYIAGSDQIWNLRICNNTTAYFLDFVSDGAVKLAYAASLGNVSEVNWQAIDANKLLANYDSISVREVSTHDYVQDNYGVSSDVVLDPVFLLAKDKWLSLIEGEKSSLKPDSYILVYYMAEDVGMFERARQLSLETGKKIIYLKGGKTKYSQCGKLIKGVGPLGYLSLFRDAAFVCTNSFHGTAFSIVLGKDFMVAGKPGQNARVDNVLSAVGLTDRYIETHDGNNTEPQFKYDKVQAAEMLNDLVMRSKAFITNGLKI